MRRGGYPPARLRLASSPERLLNDRSMQFRGAAEPWLRPYQPLLFQGASGYEIANRQVQCKISITTVTNYDPDQRRCEGLRCGGPPCAAAHRSVANVVRYCWGSSNDGASSSRCLRLNEHIQADGPTVFAHACKMASKASCRSARPRPTAPAARPSGSRARIPRARRRGARRRTSL
jgi:hypothetical protein